MKAQDLMIGDWVQGFLPDTYSRVVGILSDCHVAIMGHGCYMEVSNEDLQPIPLTPEILEKNGFEVRGRKKYFLVPNDPSLALKREPILGAHGNTFLIGHFWEVRKDFRDFIEITYIHELQHALRLCGIEKEIVL